MNRINSSYLAYEFRHFVCVVLVRAAGGAAPGQPRPRQPRACPEPRRSGRPWQWRVAVTCRRACAGPWACSGPQPGHTPSPSSCLLSLSTGPLTRPLRASVCFCICDPVPCPSALCQRQLSRLWAPGLPGADGPTSRGVTLVPLGPRLRFHQPLSCRPGPLGHLRAGRVLQAELAFPFFSLTPFFVSGRPCSRELSFEAKHVRTYVCARVLMQAGVQEPPALARVATVTFKGSWNPPGSRGRKETCK